MKLAELGIRGLFRIAIIAVVILALFVYSTVSYVNITAEEQARAEASIRSEINYLCLQLESLGNRADSFQRITSSAGVEPEDLDSDNRKAYQTLSDPVGDVLSGYTLAETGTVFLAEGDTVIASDDKRVPAGSSVQGLLGDEVRSAIDTCLEDGELQTIPFKGVFDEPGGEGAYGDNDEEAYLLAGKQGNYTVVVIEPMSMVFRDRMSNLARENLVGFIVLVLVGAIVNLLLNRLVARRIDKTNEILERITAGNLDARVEEAGTHEFVSLASGINVTVEALRGWIAEAETRMDSELAAARAIQESALPRTFPPYPEISKFDVFAIMDAAREVGGDFYDFFLIGDSDADSGKLAFLVADVSGKGVPAALFMMKAKAQVRRELQSGVELGEAIAHANAELVDGNDACMFVTMWVGVLDYATGHVDYVSAGHNPPLLWRKEAGWQQLKSRSGIPLGMLANSTYKAYSLECEAGDKILLYTDGVSEAKNKDRELYGEARLEAVANASSDAHPEALVKAVLDDVSQFAHDAEQFDDITILAIEIGSREE